MQIIVIDKPIEEDKPKRAYIKGGKKKQVKTRDYICNQCRSPHYSEESVITHIMNSDTCYSFNRPKEI